MRLQSQLLSPIGKTFAAIALLGMTACGPVAFTDSSALAVVGTPPPPPPEAAPPPPPQRVAVRDNKIEIGDKVQFEHASAKIAEVSHGLLDEVGQVIKDNPHLKKIEIQGHASSDGNDKYNLNLSDKRANAVMEYLVNTAGIKPKKLTAKGYGETKPIASNDTEEGREKNRRVEFVITKQKVTKTKVAVDEQGNETVISETTKMRGSGAKKGKRGKGKRGKKKKDQ